jgi:hypothetical protein
MIFSDLYVRFYNEAFKFVDAQGPGELEKFFAAISGNVEKRMLEKLKTGGIDALFEHYRMIRREENCEMTLTRIPHGMELAMDGCPSLGKVLDNDAAPSPRYCEHCVNWSLPLYRKAGLFCIYSIGERDVPQCREWIFDNAESAYSKRSELLSARVNIQCNFE